MVVNQGKLFLFALLNQVEHTWWKFRLAKVNPTITPATVLADIVEADFPGYAAKDVTDNSVPGLINAHGEWEQDSTNLSFTESGSDLTQTIYAVYVTMTGIVGQPESLYAIQHLPAPQTVNHVGDSINCTVKLFATDFTPA